MKKNKQKISAHYGLNGYAENYLKSPEALLKFEKIINREVSCYPVYPSHSKDLNITTRKMCLEAIKALNEYMSFFKVENTCSDRWILLHFFKRFIEDKLSGITAWRKYPNETPEKEGRYLIMAEAISYKKGRQPSQEKYIVWDAEYNKNKQTNSLNAKYDGAFWWVHDLGFFDNQVLFWQPYPEMPSVYNLDYMKIYLRDNTKKNNTQ